MTNTEDLTVAFYKLKLALQTKNINFIIIRNRTNKMQRAKCNKEVNDQNMFLKPFPKPDGHQRRKIKNGGDLFTNTNDLSNKAILNSASTQNMFKCYMKYHNASMESFKQKSTEISEKMQKTNMANAETTQENVQLKKLLRDTEQQVLDLKDTSGKLCKENDRLNQKCADLNKKYLSLEVGYDQQFTHLNTALKKQKAELTTLQQQNKDLHKELKTIKEEKEQLMVQLKTMAQENSEHLLAQIANAEAAFEQEKLQIIQQIEANHLQVRADLEQHANMLTQQLENSVNRETELQSTVTKLEDIERRNFELEGLNKQLSTEMSNATRRLEVEAEQLKLKIDEIHGQNQNLMSVEKRYQIEIAALKEANEHLIAAKAEADAVFQCELNTREIQLVELKKHIEEQQEQLNATKALSDENIEETQHLRAHKQQNEAKLVELQGELNKKNADLFNAEQHHAELDRQNNATIAELTYKIKQISNVFGQPVGTGSVIRSPQAKEQTNKTSISLSVLPDAVENSAEGVASTSASNKRRQAAKRPFVTHYPSDFNTDSEDNDTTPNWQPFTSKLTTKNRVGHGNVNVKRVRRVPRDTDESFDKLKKADTP